MVYISKLSGLILTYTFFGRVGSIPYAVFLFNNYLAAILLIFVLDVLQIFFYLWVYASFKNSGLFSKFYSFIKHRLDKIRASRTFKKTLSLGQLGVIILSALPTFGGGVWSGVLLMKILKLNKFNGIMLIILGSAVGCFLTAFGIHQLAVLASLLFNKIF